MAIPSHKVFASFPSEAGRKTLCSVDKTSNSRMVEPSPYSSILHSHRSLTLKIVRRFSKVIRHLKPSSSRISLADAPSLMLTDTSLERLYAPEVTGLLTSSYTLLLALPCTVRILVGAA